MWAVISIRVITRLKRLPDCFNNRRVFSHRIERDQSAVLAEQPGLPDDYAQATFIFRHRENLNAKKDRC